MTELTKEERLNPERVLFQVSVEQLQALWLSKKGAPLMEATLKAFEDVFLPDFIESELHELLLDGMEEADEERNWEDVDDGELEDL